MNAATGLALLLAAVFLWAGWLNLSGPAFIREEFAAWGFPPWVRPLAGAAEWLAAALLAFGETRVFGALLGAAVLVGVIATLARAGGGMRLEYPVVLLALCGLLLL
jgi:uncharacterized membrane protein YphA (DoxX/SURF4 family)